MMLWIFGIRACPWVLAAALVGVGVTARFRPRLAMRLFSAVAAISLVLLTATVVFWVRSYCRHAWIPFQHVQEHWAFASADGSLRAGPFRSVSGVGAMILPEWQCTYISLATVFSLAPFGWLVFWAVRREMRLRGNARYCTKCDYNLTGNVSGICPECGTPVEDDPGELPPAGRRGPK